VTDASVSCQQRLKGIAVDQSNEVRLQGAMLDKLEDHLDDAQGHLNEVTPKAS